MTKISEISGGSSTSFEDNEESRVRKFAKHMLKSSLFIGTFIEKRFVEPLNAYRDVIKIANDESELIENVKTVRKRLLKFFPKVVWIGITESTTLGAPVGYNLWVTLDEEVFGTFWYKIKNVEFFHNEVRVRLEIIRPVNNEKIHNITPQQILEDVAKNNYKEIGNKIKEIATQSWTEFFSKTLTWSNIKESVVFVSLLICTLVTFLVHTIQYLLDYFLKLIRETTYLIKACTPIIINLMRMVMNIVNGFYTLIAFMWRDRPKPNYNPNVYNPSIYQLPANVPYNMRALPYYNNVDYYFNERRKSPKSSVRITPLD